MHWHAQSAAARMRADSLQSRPTLSDPWTVARQAPLSVGFSRREYWSGLPFPPPGDLPEPGTEPVSPVSPAPQAILYRLSLKTKFSVSPVHITFTPPQNFFCLHQCFKSCLDTVT